jgi:hypothetical protein
LPPSRIGSRRRGKKGEARIDTEYLDRALATFSGYLAADEVYDGPFCILAIVDNRTFQRLACRVLEHDPSQQDVREFFAGFKAHLDARGLKVRGITTDGSSLYPDVIADVFPDAAHQICQFHVLKEITTAILHAVAKVRKELKARQPPLPRGRPSKANVAPARKAKRIQQRIADLFDHRHRFVQQHLAAAERKTLQRITRGLPHLRTLRQIMDEVYRLFDRRCRTETALNKLARLRRRVRRFKRVGRTLNKLFTPGLQKALTFLDDRLLPATSNAVERSHRRFRKAQRSIYSVRTAQHVRQRIALDMQRDQQAASRLVSGRAAITEGLAGSRVAVQSAHGARHLAGTGLTSQTVESAIVGQVRQATSGATATGSFWGRVTVNGRVVEYRAFTLPDGTINVGTYYPVIP